MNRRVLSLLSALILSVGLTSAALAADFPDVKKDSWYYNDVTKCVELGLMQGTSATAFSPDGAVTRAAVVTTLWRLEGSPDAFVSAPFADAKEGSWYYTALSWAKGKGIATGYGDGSFIPNAQVTREQLAIFLYRYAKFKEEPIAEGKLSLYDDADKVSSWATTGMAHAIGAGLITGDTAGRLNPGGGASRKELAVILVRLNTPVAG